MDREQLGDALIQLGEANKSYKKILKKYSPPFTEEEHIQKEVGLTVDEYIRRTVAASEDEYVEKVLPTPERRSTIQSARKPDPKKLIIFLSAFCIAAIIAVVLLFSVIHTFSLRNAILDIRADRGNPYREWLNSFGSVENFDQLEEGWATVEEDWGKRGIDINWDFVVEVKNKTYPYGGTIYANRIDYALIEAIEDLDDQSIGGTKIPALIVLCALAIFFALQLKKEYRFWTYRRKAYRESQIQINENIEFNIKLPDLIKKREEKLPAVRAEYQEKVNAARAEYPEKLEAARAAHKEKMMPILLELAPHMEVLEKYGELLPSPQYYRFATLLGLKIQLEQADTPLEAIEKMYEEHPEFVTLLDCEDDEFYEDDE